MPKRINVSNDNFPTICAMQKILLFVLYPNFQLLDVAGPVAAFEAANEQAPGSYQVRLCSQQGGLVASSSGIALPTQSFGATDTLAQAGGTLLTVGGHGINAASEDPVILEFLRTRAVQAERLASICSGAFLFAAAGLLDGKTVTTHWKRSNDFRRRFPGVQLEADRIYVNDGRVWSSAGITAGIDLALALIATDLGEQVARQVARQLVVYYRRPGGQSQYSALLELSGGRGRFAELLDYIRSHLDQPLSVEDLAARACMSPRHFARSFTAETGTSPARAVERLRVEAAASELENGGAVQTTARHCGFTNPETMRRAFLRLRGMPPSALRRG
uniref:Transcriptional regulator, AraC family with amidase-like domain n=1 Tax=Dechloromonas aromatica (strain RCB) TaxID=159087 RepID=Q47H55_DECAR